MTGQNRSRAFMFNWVTTVVLSGILALSRLLDPSQLTIMCPFRRMTGLPCMTCGLTRAFHAISVGNMREAVAYHPLGPFLYGLILFHLTVAISRLFGCRQHDIKTHSTLVYMTLGILLVSWMLRLATGSLP